MSLHFGAFFGYIQTIRSALEFVFPPPPVVEPPPVYAYQLEYVWEVEEKFDGDVELELQRGFEIQEEREREEREKEEKEREEREKEEKERDEEPTANVNAAAEDEANALSNENNDAPVGENAVEPTGEEEPLAEEPAVEAPVAAARPPHPSRALRRRDTTIIDVFEDEYIPEPEGVPFEDGQGNAEEREPLPIALVIGDVPFVKVGDFLLRAGSRKRPRTADEQEDADANEAGTSTSHKDDENERPIKRHRRCVVPTEEKRLPDVHKAIKDGVYDAMDVDDFERLQYQQEPSDVRMMWLGMDGLDDAPTPPGSPHAPTPPGSPQRTETTVAEFVFA